MPVPGQFAPDITLPRGDGTPVTLSHMRPSAVVLFFYSENGSETCTLEACAFSDATPDFAAAGARLVGISRDPVVSHDKFSRKHGLQMPLLSDETGTACTAYGVWQPKKLFGRSYMGVIRSTFLVDGAGRVARVWPAVRLKGHVAEVLAAVSALPSAS